MLANYNTSKDYKKLKKLLDKEQTIIVLNFPSLTYTHKINDWYWFGGNSHIESRGFMSFCREKSIEYLVPND